MKNDEPATERQMKRMRELGIEFDLPLTIDDAALMLRDKILGIGQRVRLLPRLPVTALAIGAEMDPVAGRQWE